MPVLVSVYDDKNRDNYAFMFVLHERFVTESNLTMEKVFKHVSDFSKPVVAGFSRVETDIQEWGDSFISAWCNLYKGNGDKELFVAGYCKECGRIAAVTLGRRNNRNRLRCDVNSRLQASLVNIGESRFEPVGVPVPNVQINAGLIMGQHDILNGARDHIARGKRAERVDFFHNAFAVFSDENGAFSAQGF